MDVQEAISELIPLQIFIHPHYMHKPTKVCICELILAYLMECISHCLVEMNNFLGIIIFDVSDLFREQFKSKLEEAAVCAFLNAL